MMGLWRWSWLDNFWRDARYAIRQLARQPGFTTVTVVSLGLGIGANAAIYSLIDRALWRQLPVREPERLVRLEGSASYFAYQQYAAKSGEVFEGVTGSSGPEERELHTGNAVLPGRVELVTGNYFQVLGTTARTGRVLLPEDDVRGQTARAAVLSHRFWRRAYDADPAVLGRVIRVGKVPFTIVGVADPEFFGIRVGQTADVWLPVTQLSDSLDSRQYNFLGLVARLQPGLTAERAAAWLKPLQVSIEIARNGNLPDWLLQKIRTEPIVLTPASQGISTLRQRFSKPLHVLLTLVGIVMLLACVNVMGLQFARADERRREIHVRLAIGAGRARVVRQLLIESLVVALGGALLGLAIYRPAATGITSLVILFGEPVQIPVALDGSMVLFVSALALGATLICGLLPALRATGGQTASGLRQGTRSATAGPMSRALGRTVASVQIGLSVVLIAGAFLFAFSLYRLTHYETGVDRRNLLVADVDARAAGYPPEQIASLNLRILERLRRMNQVESASFSGTGLYSGRNQNSQFLADGFYAESGPRRNAYFDQIGPNYFRTLHTRLLAGREFDDRDIQNGARVAIVSQAFVRHFFPGSDPVGKNIYRADDGNKTPIQVIGVVEDIRQNLRQEPRRNFYMPAARPSMPSTRFVARTQASESDLRALIRSEDQNVKVLSVDRADKLFGGTLDLDRLIAILSFAFGVLAVILAAVGIYGLLAYEVTRRTGEIGIRMALGATRGRVLSMVFREAVYVGTGGVLLGVTSALLLGKFVEALVFDMKPSDPAVFVSAALLLAAVACGAAWIPARRAARLDPMAALRNE